MQISQPMLQLLLWKKAQSTQTEATSQTSTENTVPAQNVVNTVSSPTSEDYKTADAFAMANCNRTTTAQEICNNERVLSSNSMTISDLSEADIRQIKQTIYNIYYKTSTPGGSGGSGSGSGGSTPTTPSTPSAPTISTTPGTGNINFMRDFTNVDEMFTYINTINSSVDKSTGISDVQLWELTQRDDWEENNNYFFGKLNESFNLIDSNGDDILSYDEICCFIGDEMNLSQYNTAVEQYSNYLQSLFEAMTPEEKLAFSIEKAREYLTSIGLTKQILALNRLQNEGKLGFADLNPGETYNEGTGGWTLGSYQYYTYNGGWYGDMDDFQDFDNDGYDDTTGIHWSESADFYDGNSDGIDDYFGGIFLDKYYYTQKPDTQWYDLVATLIHELTHATASFDPTDETQWGEYVAYQTGEDYLDSIGHSQWSGSLEKNEITTHINKYYDEEPVPTFDWSTYGTYV